MTTYDAAFQRVSQSVDDGTLPSAVLGIATAEGVVAMDAFGATERGPVDVDDFYRIFSITKPLVGLAAARAIERGRLTVFTPLESAMPGFNSTRDDVVRLLHLASHTSGVNEPALDDHRPLRQALAVAGRQFAAGSYRAYSSLAFEGIAALVEHALGRTWEDELARFNDALGSQFTLDEESGPHTIVGAPGFRLDSFTALRHPGAGAIARARDLLALGTSLLRGDGAVVQPATLQMMTRPLTSGIPEVNPDPVQAGQEYGFTWKLRHTSPAFIDPGAFGHGGWAGTEFWVHPDAGLAWVLMTSRPDSGFDVHALDNAVVSGL